MTSPKDLRHLLAKSPEAFAHFVDQGRHTPQHVIDLHAYALEMEGKLEKASIALKTIEGLGSVCTGQDNEPSPDCPQCIAWQALKALSSPGDGGEKP